MSADPQRVGTVVLATLEAGRLKRLAERQRRATELAELVERAARLDRAAGHPDRGRAARIARRLHLDGIAITERWARKILGTVGPSVPHSRDGS